MGNIIRKSCQTDVKFNYFIIFFQARVRNGIEKVERAIKMVNELELFSKNEDLEEIASNEIK